MSYRVCTTIFQCLALNCQPKGWRFKSPPEQKDISWLLFHLPTSTWTVHVGLDAQAARRKVGLQPKHCETTNNEVVNISDSHLPLWVHLKDCSHPLMPTGKSAMALLAKTITNIITDRYQCLPPHSLWCRVPRFHSSWCRSFWCVGLLHSLQRKQPPQLAKKNRQLNFKNQLQCISLKKHMQTKASVHNIVVKIRYIATKPCFQPLYIIIYLI